MSRRELISEAGFCKVAFVAVYGDGPEHVLRSQLLLESVQEWEALRQAYYEDPRAGYTGRFGTVPKGVAVVALRLENPEVFGA